MKKIIAIVLIISVLAAAYFFLKPDTEEGMKDITVEVIHLDGEQAVFSFTTDAEYLRQALEEQELVSGAETEYGLWITTVDGETADEGKQQVWGFSVNGELAMYGVDEQVIADGDTVIFELHEGYDWYM